VKFQHTIRIASTDRPFIFLDRGRDWAEDSHPGL
jgi:hypothetical protein